MSNSLPPLPDAAAFLAGTDGVKPHQHDASALQRLMAGLEETPLTPKAAETIAQLGEVMQKPEWQTAHDTAHGALREALNLTNSKAAAPEIVAQAHTVETLFRSRAPNAESVVTGVPTLDAMLAPFKHYAEQFESYLRGWAGLSPQRMRPAAGEAGVTPKQHRADLRAKVEALQASNPGITIPACGDLNCNVDHSAGASTNTGAFWHVHSADCGHAVAETSKPKAAMRWAVGIAAVAGVVYLIHGNSNRRKQKEDAATTQANWQNRLQSAGTVEEKGRIL